MKRYRKVVIFLILVYVALIHFYAIIIFYPLPTTGEEIDSVIAVRDIVEKEKDRLFCGGISIMFINGRKPELSRLSLEHFFRLLTFSFWSRKERTEWFIFLFSQEEENANALKVYLESTLRQTDNIARDNMHVKTFHFILIQHYPAPQTVDSLTLDRFKKEVYADFRIDIN